MSETPREWKFLERRPGSSYQLFGAMFRPPIEGGLHFALRLLGDHDAETHAPVSI